MNAFYAVLGFIGALLVLALAGFGAISLVAVVRGDDERRQLEAQTRRAERQIMEIGQQAQLAILGEALRRIAVPQDCQPTDGDGHDQNGNRHPYGYQGQADSRP